MGHLCVSWSSTTFLMSIHCPLEELLHSWGHGNSASYPIHILITYISLEVVKCEGISKLLCPIFSSLLNYSQFSFIYITCLDPLVLSSLWISCQSYLWYSLSWTFLSHCITYYGFKCRVVTLLQYMWTNTRIVLRNCSWYLNISF